LVVITTVFDRADAAVPASLGNACVPATCRIGLLGLGHVGSAFARLARDCAPQLASRGFLPIVSAALVRSPRARASTPLANRITDDADAFFSEPVDVVVEALGGVDPAYTLVRRALDRGIPVVTANKSLIAARGDELSLLARRRATALRYEASCIAGVPFLGTFERRPLACCVSWVTAILNGTSNAILTAMTSGAPFAAALADAQRLGLAEPDPAMDVSGRDAAEKLAILIRLFGRLAVAPSSLPIDGIDGVEPHDVAAAAAFGGAIKPVAHASWSGDAIRAFVGPAFVDGVHPLSRVGGVTNGILIGGDRGVQCYSGPGAGPDVTAATLLDDVAEVIGERRVRTPSPEAVRAAASTARTDTPWFLRLTGAARDGDVADLLGSYGIWCTRLSRRADRTYVITCGASHARVTAAVRALEAATRGHAAAFPAIVEEAAC
jgi:homoserine dehydrogenase